MVTRRSAKNKGNQMEYNCWYSIKKVFPNIKLSKEMGYQAQHDLIDDVDKMVVECKCHKGFSWNEIMKYMKKLETKAPTEEYKCHVIFKSNRQPVLIMYKDAIGSYTIKTFESYFHTKFEKHESFRKTK